MDRTQDATLRQQAEMIVGIVGLLEKTPLSPEQDGLVKNLRSVVDAVLKAVDDRAAIDDAEATPPEKEGSGADLGPQPIRILLVEDSSDNRTIELAYLQDTPYHVEIAENGAIACERFKAGRFDLVLMGRQMPVMDGLTATRALRDWEQANDRTPTPIIALTASALKEDIELFVAAGCSGYLTKPIQRDVLLQAIQEHCHRAASASSEVPVPAQASFSGLVPVFLQNRRQDVIAALDALDRADFKAVATMGHNMRGAGTSYGFQAITAIGAALEQAAEGTDTVASRKWVGELSRYLDGVERVPLASEA